jgi:hypothetical protein
MSLRYSTVRTEHMLIYFRYGDRHRTDGPAKIIYYVADTHGYIYIQYGQYHRCNGPAWDGMEKMFYYRGKREYVT